MEDIELSESHLLSLLYEKGYEIKVEKKSTGGYSAYFNHRVAVNPSSKYNYSSEWTEEEIREDLASKLLQWSGLKKKIVLDY